jgi:hypothetical protein
MAYLRGASEAGEVAIFCCLSSSAAFGPGDFLFLAARALGFIVNIFRIFCNQLNTLKRHHMNK